MLKYQCKAVENVCPAGTATFRADGIHVDFSFEAATINGVQCPAATFTIMVPHLATIHNLFERLIREHAAPTPTAEVRGDTPDPLVQPGRPLAVLGVPDG